ncbi:MAG: DUF123 domain-containing protein [Methanosarcinaceae archaeon]|nr:DUF123 domain-containing protein [Methanosarcinaceae archaeon]
MKESLSASQIQSEFFDASAPSPFFSEKGLYCLIFKNPKCSLSVGKKGNLLFRSGFHIYVGSALGSGGLKRVIRHIKLSENKDKKPKWHVDFLHLSPVFSLNCAICAPSSEKLEYILASKIGGGSVPGFGCTDCGCAFPLFYRFENPRE